jgi:MarR family transcriptional regulator, organic hydroperoxide resistance regulator
VDGRAGATLSRSQPRSRLTTGSGPPLVYRPQHMARRPLRRRHANHNTALEFLRLLWAVDHQLQRASKRLARDLGVTGPQRLAIRVIATEPGLSPQEVAVKLHLHKSTVTGILQRLEEQRLIGRTVDASDKRRSHLHLTPRGHRISRSKGPTIERTVQRALAGLPAPAIDGAGQVLAAIAARLQADMGEHSPRRVRSRVVALTARKGTTEAA